MSEITPVIRVALASDADGCHQLLRRVLVSADADEDAGFLIEDATIDKIRVLFSRGPCRVADHHGKIVGFVLAFRTESLEFLSLRERLGETLWATFIEHVGSDSLYIDRVAVAPEYRRHNIGRRLYESLFKVARGSVVALLVEEPILNRASVGFHLALGFTRVGGLRLNEYRSFRPFATGIYVTNNHSS